MALLKVIISADVLRDYHHLGDISMSLNNVYYWAKDSWKKITAEEVVKNNPDIRVSAKGKIFWCEMCGQFVTLANGDINKPHFRHSSAELKKFCSDRSKNFYKDDWFKSPKLPYNLPLKICVEQNNFVFQIGLIKLPHQIFEKVKNCRIKISTKEKTLKYRDLSDDLLEEEITWIDVKNIPAETYFLTLEPKISDISFYWTEKIQGINTEGTLFNAKTGRKILYDADIKIHTKYYLLSTRKIKPPKSVTKQFVMCRNISGVNWVLYEVEATELSEEAAKFFLNYHCRLTANPISIIQIYPVYTQENDIIHCNCAKMFLYFSGNAKIKFFPFTEKFYLSEEKNFKIIETEVNEQAQMIAAGRSEILQYAYIWKDLPTCEMELPKVEVSDINGKNISDGVTHILPKNSRLQVTAQFDGKIIKSANGVVKEKIFFKAGMIFDVKDITFGTEIKIFQGLDCVWKIFYQREEKGNLKTDTEIFLKLERGRGKKIQIPHTWGSLTDKLKNYPKVQSWLYKSIRFGFVNEESYLLFRQFILKVV